MWAQYSYTNPNKVQITKVFYAMKNKIRVLKVVLSDVYKKWWYVFEEIYLNDAKRSRIGIV